MATRNYPSNITALGLRVNRRSIVPVRDFQTIKLRKSIVKRCNRYDNGFYGLKDVVCSELYSRRENLNISIFCGRKAPHKYKYKAEGYPLFPFNRMTNDYIMTNEILELIMM